MSLQLRTAALSLPTMRLMCLMSQRQVDVVKEGVTQVSQVSQNENSKSWSLVNPDAAKRSMDEMERHRKLGKGNGGS
jgi:hypothetical protein